MTDLLQRLHTRLGDFWWYSLLMFVALRCGDVINAVVGLWLVPKYVPQEELGAVLPLTQFASVIGLPVSILVVAFTKFLTEFKTKGESGKVKSLLRWFIGFVIVSSLLSVVLAKFSLPALFERIRVQDGSLTLLIVATGIISTVAPVFNNALQGLKKFKTITFLNLINAPIRLVSMLFLLPIRALSGYMAGQLVPSIVAIITSVFALRRHVDRSVVSVPFWKDDKKPILRFLFFTTLLTIPGTLFSMITTTIIRQRLPEVESAAYYMISRFAEISTYAGVTLSFVMFPMATEASVKNDDAMSVLYKMSAATFGFGMLATFAFWIFGDYLFTILPMYTPYRPFVPELVILSASLTINLVGCNFMNYEIAQGRFTFLWVLLIALSTTAFLVCFTGYTFFYGILPTSVVDWMGSLHVASLRKIILINTIGAVGNVILFAGIIVRRKFSITVNSHDNQVT